MEDFIPEIINRNSIGVDFCLDNDFEAGNALSTASIIETQQIDPSFNFSTKKVGRRRRSASYRDSKCSKGTRCVEGSDKEEWVKAYYEDDEIINLKGGDDYYYSFNSNFGNGDFCSSQWTEGSKEFSMGPGNDFVSLMPSGHPLNKKQVIKGNMGKGDDHLVLYVSTYSNYSKTKARVKGGKGDDYLYTNLNNSVLEGGSGDDLIVATASYEKMTITGGNGADIFGLYLRKSEETVAESRPGIITITDFSPEEGDRISISNTINHTVRKDGNDLKIYGNEKLKYALIKNISKKEFMDNNSMINGIDEETEEKYDHTFWVGDCVIDKWIWSEEQYYM